MNETDEAANGREEPPQAGASSGIPVVGLGGSAGALECFKEFFEALPADSGAAFVVVQHMAPAHESLLPEILARATPMKVVLAEDAQPVEPNCVHVIPPGAYLRINDGVLYLDRPPKQANVRLPVDAFLRSLAEDRQERALCVIFSGTGADGTAGVRAIRGAGGLTIAQDPRSAQYGDMPRSAIATRMVDLILEPRAMPQAIADYLCQPYVRGGEPAAALEAEGRPGGLGDILATVYAQTGNDFRSYKKSTILRRIERRRVVRHVFDLAEYGALLGREAAEVRELHKDLLINVTTFFRNTEAFEELRLKVIAPLVAARQPEEPIRVWVAGCSSGEEAYSILMLLFEELEAARKSCPVQVFATDIDEDALEIARRGLYPESVAADVGPARLAKFFVKTEKGCQIAEPLRATVVFALQNLITDPPFSKVDLLSCRNLLIYVEEKTQAKLVPLFNFALNPEGCLFLGKSEGVGGQEDLFSTVSKKWRIFRRRAAARAVLLDLPIAPGVRMRAVPSGAPAARPPAVAYAELIRQALLSHFSACVVLADVGGQILQFHGQSGRYLNLPDGEPRLNLRDIAKEGLAMRLRTALHAAVDQNQPIVLDQVPITREEGSAFARVTVAPLAPRGGEQPLLLAVIFEEVPRPAPTGAAAAPSRESETVVRELEDELRATQRELQSSIEDLQSANEELRVSNEEVTSTNEELQSANEELETSTEELQSVNEELTTVNSQLQEKVERLDAAASDMSNLLTSTRIATLFLDEELRIKFFTQAATGILRLLPLDIGRPVQDLSADFVDFELTPDARAVLKGGPIAEREVRRAGGSICQVRVLPYCAKDGRVEGVVATFEDVTEARRLAERSRRLVTLVENSSDALVLFDPEGRIRAWNRGAETLYGWSEEQALGMNVRDIVPADAAAETDGLFHRLRAGERITSFETRRRTREGRALDVWLTINGITDQAGAIEAIATTERDMSERKQAEKTLRQNVNLAQSNKDLEYFATVASHDLQEPLRVVTSYLGLLQERYRDKLDAAADEFIAFAVDGAERMSSLIDGLLVYSRVDSKGRAPAATSAQVALEGALANLRPGIEEAGASVTHDELPTVLADGRQLVQVFQNLVGNAVKFRREGAPCEIRIGARREGGEWVLSVGDNGIGIPAGKFEHIFLIFQRLHTREKYPGTGIGLAICKRIVERHGGRVWVESTLGTGSTFFFTLPAAS